jgi:hypothetical protein
MIDRLILGVALSVVGFNGLFPDPPPPVTPLTLKEKAKMKSVSAVCERKKKQKQNKTVQQLCKRWEVQKNG